MLRRGVSKKVKARTLVNAWTRFSRPSIAFSDAVVRG